MSSQRSLRTPAILNRASNEMCGRLRHFQYAGDNETFVALEPRRKPGASYGKETRNGGPCNVSACDGPRGHTHVRTSPSVGNRLALLYFPIFGHRVYPSHDHRDHRDHRSSDPVSFVRVILGVNWIADVELQRSIIYFGQPSSVPE